MIEGQATFAGPDTIRVGDRMLQAKHIAIATGSKPRPLPTPGAKHNARAGVGVMIIEAVPRLLPAMDADAFVGHDGRELINVFGLAIKFGITARQLKDHYPTFSADIRHMFAHA
jgi:glutathione reductase (NADPH)